MTTLVVGATGATGRLFVEQLLDRGQDVRVVVRSPDALPSELKRRPGLSVIHAAILEIGDNDLAQHVGGCSAVASCLGHTMNLKGIYGRPRNLVTKAVSRLCNSIRSNRSSEPTKFVLMNTAGYSNRDLHEPTSPAHRSVLRLVRLTLPPHVDNENAAEHLRTVVGQHDRTIEWCVVRPDTLRNEDHVSEYSVHDSPVRGAIFDPGRTSRINVAHFMAELITDNETWHQWKGKMPVIYDSHRA